MRASHPQVRFDEGGVETGYRVTLLFRYHRATSLLYRLEAFRQIILQPFDCQQYLG